MGSEELDNAPTRPRRPFWVYEQGTEPDYRFSYANERTYLAWLRTSLALIASGVAINFVAPTKAMGSDRVLSFVLVLLGISSAVLAAVRWARAEQAMRLSQPLPGFALVAVIPLGLTLTGLVLGLLLW